MTLVVFNTAWMDSYAALPGDVPKGFNNAPGFGEILNFAPMRSRMYGWVQTSGLDLVRLGASAGAPSKTGVTIVWTARRPGVGKVVVGVYNNATIFAEPQEHSKPRLESRYGTIQAYIAVADRDDAILISPPDRTFKVPHGRGLPGTHPVWYGDSAEAKSFLRRLTRYLASLTKKNPPASSQPSRRGGPRRPLDPEVRRAVEKAAVEAFNEFAQREYKGKILRDAQKDNLGWDAEVYPKNYKNADQTTSADAELLVEIKGNSGTTPSIELSPNEYAMLKLHWQRYRIAIVTDALTSGPKLRLFAPASADCKVWLDKNRNRLTIKEVVGARLF